MAALRRQPLLYREAQSLFAETVPGMRFDNLRCRGVYLIPSGEPVVIFLVPGSYPFSGQPCVLGTVMILASLLKFPVSIFDLVCSLFLEKHHGQKQLREERVYFR